MPYVLPYQPTTQDKLRDALIAALPQIALAAATKGMSLIGSIPNPAYGQAGTPGTVFGKAPQGQLTLPQNAQQVMGGFKPQVSNPYASLSTLNPSQFENLQNLQKYQQGAEDIAYKRSQTAANNPAFQGNVLRQALGLPPIGTESSTAASGGPMHYQDPSTGQLVMEYGGKKYKVSGVDATGKPLYDPL